MQASVDNLQQTIGYGGIAGMLPPSLSLAIHILPQCKIYAHDNRKDTDKKNKLRIYRLFNLNFRFEPYL